MIWTPYSLNACWMLACVEQQRLLSCLEASSVLWCQASADNLHSFSTRPTLLFGLDLKVPLIVVAKLGHRIGSSLVADPRQAGKEERRGDKIVEAIAPAFIADRDLAGVRPVEDFDADVGHEHRRSRPCEGDIAPQGMGRLTQHDDRAPRIFRIESLRLRLEPVLRGPHSDGPDAQIRHSVGPLPVGQGEGARLLTVQRSSSHARKTDRSSA